MTQYIGRFAPSPTGPLHLGSLYTALASYLDAKAHYGKWLLRIEDLDPPREDPAAAKQIIQTLEAHGLLWDGDIEYQSLNANRYKRTIAQLFSLNKAFYCTCSRQNLAEFNPFYPGTCHGQVIKPEQPHAIRLLAPTPIPTFTDRHSGLESDTPPPEGCGLDFVIFRKDELFAYQLAVVVDDIEAGVTDIVRGNDILDSTFKQLYLYDYLGQKPPQYLHLPVIMNKQGQKLSKQNLAQAVDNAKPCENLLLCLKLLGQTLPPEEKTTSIQAILDWSIEHWDTSKLSAQAGISP